MEIQLLVFVAIGASLLTSQAQATGKVSSSDFHREVNCTGQVPLDPGQAYHVTRGLGRVGCAMLCSQEEACLSYTTSDPDCLLYPVRLQTCGPSPSPSHASYYVKERNADTKCYNGDTMQTDSCACPDYTQGTMCEHVMRDCNDWSQWSTVDDVYWVKPQAASHSFQVSCQLDFELRNTFVHYHYRTGSMISFNRTWEEYKNGFGDVSGYNYWLGLEKLYWLTAGRSKNLTLVVNALNLLTKYEYPLRTYGHFRIGDESTGFEMLQYLGGSNGSLTDCMNDVIGSKFVTYDHGEDDSLLSCAGQLGAGWWIRANGTDCSFKCNPNGHLRKLVDPPQTGDVYFQDFNATWVVMTVYMFLGKL